jgi:Bacteriophage Mu, GemA protein
MQKSEMQKSGLSTQDSAVASGRGSDQPRIGGCGSACQPLGGRGGARSISKTTARLALATAIDGDDQTSEVSSQRLEVNSQNEGNALSSKLKTPNSKPKTAAQLRAIYAEGRRRGLDNDALHVLVIGSLSPQSSALKSGSLKDLSYTEAQRAIQRLKGRDFVPLRTLQYRRQRAGVQQLITSEHEEKIAALATQRNWSAERLVNFCKRQCGHYPLRTTQDANKVIEGLKAMNQRDDLWAA